MTIAAAAAIIPLFVWPLAKDTFRLPKELLARAAVIVAGASLCISIVFDHRTIGSWIRVWRRQAVVSFACLAIVLWSVLVTLTSTNRPLSMFALLWAMTVILFFLMAVSLAQRATLLAAEIVLIPLVINAATAILQELKIWNPFHMEAWDHSATTAFVGNPNDVGAYVVPGILAALALVVIGQRRRISFVVMLLGIMGLLATQTLTAIVAFAVGAISMLLVVPKRGGRAIGTAILILIVVAVLLAYPLLPTFRERVHRMAVDIVSRDYDDLLSARLLPFASAWYMAVDHPIVGVGPGCFNWHYFDYKIRVARAHPMAAESALRGVNYGEVHNEYLQILAEAGVVGLLLLLSAMVILARVTFERTKAVDARQEFAHVLAFPLSMSFAVLALAQFPLHLAAPCLTYVYLAGLCISWSR